MAPIIPDPRKIRAFESERDFAAWLAAHHDRETEVYLRIYKKDSRVKTVTYAQALDVALCWGWIDGIRKAYDAQSFLQRFTPRRPKSLWSQINRKHVQRLIAAGRMTRPGLAQVEAAKADGRWKAAYAPGRTMKVPPDLLAAIEAEPRALATFRKLNRQNLFALGFRMARLKTPAGRARAIARFVQTLRRGETILPV
jgi:uncharacterized protein YdeI (YjbR/CyaY-like superfamily)